MIYYNKNNVKKAQELRKRMTPWEKKVWYDILSKRDEKWYRQKPIGNYIADFYSPVAKLIVEIDGEWHRDDVQELNDKTRTKYFNTLNIRVIRFRNKDIIENPEGVAQVINAIVNDRISGKVTYQYP